MNPGHLIRIASVAALVALGVTRSNDAPAALGDYAIAPAPLYMGSSEPPLMMLVLSRDEQLFNKAYSDYTDLKGTGKVNTTYEDTFEYAGYFDPNLCYASSSGVFSAVARAAGANKHSCAGQWSGNFLNWATMSRLDILRYVLYGGKRVASTDGATGGVRLERAEIPNDVHAWAKVFTDSGKFTPYTGTYTLCNATVSPNPDPRMLVASGNWSEWAATEVTQCLVGGNSERPSSTVADLAVRANVCGNADANLREAFCRPYANASGLSYKPAGLLQEYGESGKLRFGLISGSYNGPRSGGVLRRNIGKIAGNAATACATGDEINTSTGQFCAASSGTVAEGIIPTIDNLRIADKWGTDSRWSDCNAVGITNRQGNSFDAKNLDNPGTADNGLPCSAWGNPLAEMYAEALRYIAGAGTGTGTFSPKARADLAKLPIGVAWKDPYGADSGNSYCAQCSILVLSSGLPSFDSDELTDVTIPGPLGNAYSLAKSATKPIGEKEGLSATSNFTIGRYGETPLGTPIATFSDMCQTRTGVADLSLVRGICPDIPSMEGSYLLAGLANAAYTTDLRPGLPGKPADRKFTVRTFSVAMAENLPKFEINTGSGVIGIAPLCAATFDGSAKVDAANRSKWRSCFLASVGVGPKRANDKGGKRLYGRDMVTVPGAAAGETRATAGSYSLVWEDSLFGNDHDKDVVTMMTFCVGAECNFKPNASDVEPSYKGSQICWRSDSPLCVSTAYSPTVGAGEALIRVETLTANAMHAITTGMFISGAQTGTQLGQIANGENLQQWRPGYQWKKCTDKTGKTVDTWIYGNDSLLSDHDGYDADLLANGCYSGANLWTRPQVYKVKASGVRTGALKDPLWYAAKYGSFTKRSDDQKYPNAGDWEAGKEGGEDVPNGYFLARDPSKLKSALDAIFRTASAANTQGTGGSGAGLRLNAGSYTVGSTFAKREDSNDWTGDLLAYKIKADGTRGDKLWSASEKLTGASGRRIFTALSATSYGARTAAADAPVKTRANVVMFSRSGLGSTDAQLMAAMGMSFIPTWMTGATIGDLIDYLTGNRVKEIKNTGGKFRDRSALLGDIINSNTELVTSRDDYGWGMWTGGAGWRNTLGTNYRKFLDDRAKSGASAAFVNANDGMLHAFSGGTSGGSELFAYAPGAVRESMFALGNPKYEHAYFMDGQISVGDVANSANSWRSVLVTSAGAGARTVTAIDVTTPSLVDAGSVLWEIRGSDFRIPAGDSDLGMVMGKVAIVPVKGGSATAAPRWVAIFGNGVNSLNGQAVLYVVDVLSGNILRKISVGAPPGVKNGLMTTVAISLADTSGLVDTVYGGDLSGNLWKFDLSSTTPSEWKVAYRSGTTAVPLFTARDPSGNSQPITGGLEVSLGATGAPMIYFGTGRYFVTGDHSTKQVQSLYAIVDKGVALTGNRTEVLARQIMTAAGEDGTKRQLRSTGILINKANNGWFLDLALDGSSSTGERFIGNPTLQSGKVLFGTFEPNADSCGANGTNWLYGLDLLTGNGALGGLSYSVSGNSVCEGACGAVSGQKGAPVKDVTIMVPQPQPLTDCSATGTCTDFPKLEQYLQKCTMIVNFDGVNPMTLPRACGRQSWRQIR